MGKKINIMKLYAENPTERVYTYQTYRCYRDEKDPDIQKALDEIDRRIYEQELRYMEKK